MRKKKLVSALLICMLALTGCGGNKNTESKRDSVLDNIDEKDKKTTETQVEITEEEETEEEEKEEENIVAPKVEVQGEFVEERSLDGGSIVLCTLTYNTINLNESSLPELSAALDDWSSKRKSELQSMLEEYATMASEDTELMEECLSYEYPWMYDIYQSLKVQRSDSKVVSLIEHISTYTASDSDIYKYIGLTFDVETGKQLSLEDILVDKDGFYTAATDYIIEDLRNHPMKENLISGYEEKVADMWNHNVSWCLDASGITITFNPGDADEIIDPSATFIGVRTTLPYSEFSKYIHEKYSGAESKGVSRLYIGEEYSLNTDNGMVSVSVELKTDENSGYSSSVIQVGNSSLEVEGFSEDAYILNRDDGKVFLLITCDYMSDDYVTSLYDITDGKIKLCDEIVDAVVGEGTINNDRVTLSVHLDVLGSYISKAEYKIDQNGKFSQVDDMFRFESYALYIIKDLPVVINGTNTVIPEGTRICITGTDNTSIITFFNVDTDEIGEIHFERGEGDDSWMIYINGCSEFDYFENLPYAG